MALPRRVHDPARGAAVPAGERDHELAHPPLPGDLSHGRDVRSSRPIRSRAARPRRARSSSSSWTSSGFGGNEWLSTVAVAATVLALLFVLGDLGFAPLSVLATLPSSQIDARRRHGRPRSTLHAPSASSSRRSSSSPRSWSCLASASRPSTEKGRPDLLRASPARDAGDAAGRGRLRPHLPAARHRGDEHRDVPPGRLPPAQDPVARGGDEVLHHRGALDRRSRSTGPPFSSVRTARPTSYCDRRWPPAVGRVPRPRPARLRVPDRGPRVQGHARCRSTPGPSTSTTAPRAT